jgi:hypothetical protein
VGGGKREVTMLSKMLTDLSNEDIIEGLLSGVIADNRETWKRMAIACDMDFYRRRNIELCVDALYEAGAVRGDAVWRRIIDGPSQAELQAHIDEFTLLEEDEMLAYFLEDQASDWFLETFHSVVTDKAWDLISSGVNPDKLDRIMARAMAWLQEQEGEGEEGYEEGGFDQWEEEMGISY